MDKQAVLNLSKAETMEGNKFKIQVGDKFYIYQVPEEKEVDVVVDKINNWVNKGVDQWGGLYDYINRNFKLLSPEDEIADEEPKQETEELQEEPEETEGPNDKDIRVEEHDNKITITIDDKYSADFNPKDSASIEEFKASLTDVVKDEMTPEDYAMLLKTILDNLEPENMAKFAEFISAFTGESVESEIEDETGVDIPEETPEDEVTDEEPQENTEETSDVIEEPVEDEQVGEAEEFEGSDIESQESIEDIEAAEKAINDLDLQQFIDKARDLGLSVFEFKEREPEIPTNEAYYLIGRISPDNGLTQYLSYGDDDEEPLLDLPETYEEIKEIKQCLNNVEIHEKVLDYLDRISQTIIELDNKVTLEDMDKGE